MTKLRILAILAATAMLGACAAPPFDAVAVAKEWGAYMQQDYVLRPNDQVSISLHPEGQLGVQSFVVPSSGSIQLARIEEPILAVGQPMRMFRAKVQALYRKQFGNSITVQVSLLSTAVKTVYVFGEVTRPAPVNYLPGMTLSQAIAGAGGFVYRAKLRDVRVIRPNPDDPNQVPKLYRVNVNDVFHHQGQPDFLVLPGDVIYCQSLWVAELADMFNLYLWALLPFRNPTSAVTAF